MDSDTFSFGLYQAAKRGFKALIALLVFAAWSVLCWFGIGGAIWMADQPVTPLVVCALILLLVIYAVWGLSVFVLVRYIERRVIHG